MGYFRKGNTLSATTKQTLGHIEKAHIYCNGALLNEPWNSFDSLAEAEKQLRRETTILMPDAKYSIVVAESSTKVYHYE